MPIEQLVDGMTVNERLAYFKLFEAMDSAVASRDHDAIVAVLRRAKLTEIQATQTTEAILSNPTRYGYR